MAAIAKAPGEVRLSGYDFARGQPFERSVKLTQVREQNTPPARRLLTSAAFVADKDVDTYLTMLADAAAMDAEETS